jgi:carbonic anhydrase
MTSPTKALARLVEGNLRFRTHGHVHSARTDGGRRGELLDGQAPYAVVLGCSDSRVPPELIFDEGLGDLFVIRVAGNVAAPSQVESVEYAVEHLGAQLVVVLGHSACGAVQATIEHLVRPGEAVSPVLSSVVELIEPAIEGMTAGDEVANTPREAVRANVRTQLAALTRNSTGLARRVEAGELLMVGADYDLETGVVEFLNEDGAAS